MTKLDTPNLVEPNTPFEVLYENDIVYQLKADHKWYFWDESYLENGPFDTEHEARIGLVLYCWFCLDNKQWAVPPRELKHLYAKLS